jgi:hypothetical protein
MRVRGINTAWFSCTNGNSWANTGIVESSSSRGSSVYFGRFPLSNLGEAKRHARGGPPDDQFWCTNNTAPSRLALQDLQINRADSMCVNHPGTNCTARKNAAPSAVLVKLFSCAEE